MVRRRAGRMLRRARPQRPAACSELLTRAVEADILFLSRLQNLAGLGVDEMNPPACDTRHGLVGLAICWVIGSPALHLQAGSWAAVGEGNHRQTAKRIMLGCSTRQ